MTDKAKLLKLFTSMGMSHWSDFSDPQYIHGDAVKAGAASCIALGNLDFNFDKQDNFIGINTDAIRSFKPRKVLANTFKEKSSGRKRIKKAV